MTAYELKEKHEKYHPDSYFFSKTALNWFGVDMSESRVMGPFPIVTKLGEKKCYILEELKNNHPDGPTWEHTLFDAEDYQVVSSG